jgi:N-acetylneuraminic acid mutarotase
LLQRLLRGGLLLVLINATTARADSWQRLADVPGRRAAHSAVWTGNELIVWGGGVDGQFLNTGARYIPATDTWQVTSPYGAPSPRWFHAAVWTGSEMIVWGGRPDFFSSGNLNDGARYQPNTDTWALLSNEGAPTGRSQCVAVWSGSEMIIWGGETEGGVPLADGAAYNPVTDTWRPISATSGLAPRMESTAIWTGSEMIVFGGVDTTRPGWLSYGDGARYDPFTDTWTPLPADGAPSSRTAHTAVWTGERMIVWGGWEAPSRTLLNTGASFDPGANNWTPLLVDAASSGRMYHAAVWSGTEMIVWGGQDLDGVISNTGARYKPASRAWTATTQENAAGKRQFWRPDLGLWTGRGMLVCAGSDYPASLDSTAIYFPVPSVRPPVTTDVLIRFDPPSLPGGSRLIEFWNESGFNFVTATGGMAHTDSRVSTNRPGNGTAYLQFGFGQKPLIISSLTGQPFAIKRVDLAEYSTVFPVPKTVTFTGYHADGSSTAQSFTTDGVIDGGGPLADFETFTFPASFSNLVRVEVMPDGYSLDNLLVSVATNVPPPPPVEPVYDLSRDYSLASNPNGPWSYGYLTALNDGSFGLLRASRTFTADNGVPIAAWELETYQLPGVWKVLGPEVAHSDGDHFTAEAGTVYFAPGADGAPQNFGALRFTVPADGPYRIETSVRSLFDHERSRDADFHVLKNGHELFGQFLPPNSAASYSNVVTLAAGDRVDFAIGRGADGLTADTGLKIQAALTPLNAVTNPPPRPTNCVPAPHGLVAWWAGENNANDLVGTNRGVLLGGTRYATGQVGRAFSFTTSSNGVKIAASRELDVGLGSGMTIELWINPDDVTESGPLVEWNNGVDLWGAHFWILPNQSGAGLQPPSSAIAGPGQLYAAFTLLGQWFQMVSDAGVLAPHTFQHVALTYDKSMGLGRIYRNGSLVAEQTLGVFTPQTAYDLYLGLRPAGPPGDPQAAYHGLMDEVSVYNRALTPTEILSIYTANRAGKCLTNNPPTPPPPTNCAPAPEGLAAWWRGEGNAQDAAGMHPGTVVGNVAYAPGVVGQGFHFDGLGGYVRIPNDEALDFPRELTIELWYKHEGLPSDAYGLVSARGTDVRPVNYAISVIPTGIGPYFNDPEVASGDDAEYGGTYEASRYLPVPSSGVFHHLAVTFRQASATEVELKTFIDGALVRTKRLAAQLANGLNDTAIVIGRSNEDGGEWFQGVIDEVAIYRRALSDAEISAIAAAGAAGKCPTNRPPQPPPVASFDLSRDYSLAANPNGPWSYGYLTALSHGSFGLLGASRTFSADNGVPIAAWELETYQLPGVWKVLGPEVAHSDADHFTAEPGTVYFAPGADGAPENFGAIRFTVPADGGGNYRIETTVVSLFDHDRSRDADFHVLKNGQELFGQFLSPNSGTGYSNVLALVAGDSIDFAIGRGADGLTADTGLKIQASLTPLTRPTNPPPARATYDLKRDYSTNANPNGVWSFGWKSVLNGPFTLFTFHDSVLDQGALIDYWLMNEQGPSSVYHNAGNVTLINNDGQGVYPPGTVWFGPGYDENPDNFSIIRFTVPPNGAGAYELATTVLPALDGPISGDTDFHVLRNGSSLFEEFLPPNTGTSYSNVITLRTGDTIEFACGRGRDGYAYASALKIDARLRLLGAVTNPPPLRVYDLSRGFSASHNPNGVWSFGYQTTLGGAFTLLTFPLTSFADNPVPVDSWSKNGYEPVAVYHNGTTNTSLSDGGAGAFPPGTTWFYPGVEGHTDNYGVIRFTVPPGSSGIYQLHTEVRAYLDGPRSGDTDFHVLKNGGELFAEFIPGNSGAGFSNLLSLVGGDTIDFAVGRGRDNLAFDSGLKIRASLALMATRMSIDRILSVTNGACRVIGHAPPGAICRIVRSKNLVDWEHAGFAVTTNEGVFEFIDLQSPPGPACFYRLQDVQP